MFEHYEILRSDLCIKGMVDGGDASGKGTTVRRASIIASNLGYDVITLDLPHYQSPIGSQIKKILNDSENELSLPEQIGIFALNRVEVLDLVMKQIREIESRGNKFCLLLDRSHFSNVFTCAYYFLRHKVSPEDYRKLMEVNLDLMLDVDKYFIKILGLENSPLSIPFLPVEQAMSSLSTDSKRQGADKYEERSVQEVALDLYRIVAERFPNQFNIFNQIEDGRRLNDEEIAVKVLANMGLDFSANLSRQGNIYNFVSPSSPGEIYIDSIYTSHILSRLGFDDLRLLYTSIYERAI